MRRLLIAVVVLLVGFVPVPPVFALSPGGTFLDDDGDVHEGAIEAIAAVGVTVGCDELGERFCPDRLVTRAEMATFLVRALGLEPQTPQRFTDAVGVHELSIGAVEAAGLFKGCNPPGNDLFCPDEPLTRGQAAAVLVRAFDLGEGSGVSFADVGGSVFADAIGRLAAAGVTRGCDPPANERFCPDRGLSRAEMATFLTRLMGLTPNPPDPPFAGRIVLGFWSDLVGPAGFATMEGSRIPEMVFEDTVGEPRLSSDGTTIAYYDYRRECPPDAAGPWDCFHRIFTVPFAGGEELQMTPNTLWFESYSWLPDSRSLGIVVQDNISDDGEQADWTLATVAVDEPLQVNKLGGPSAYALWSAEWSVNGDIVATAQTEGGNAMVAVFDSSGRPQSVIASASQAVFGPKWSPDGSKLAYVVADVDTDEVVVSNPDGSGRRVIATEHRISDVAWSPDGTRLAYYVDNLSPYGVAEVVVADLDDGSTQVVASVAAAGDIVWSPDGSMIGYIDESRVWAVAATGGNPWPLTPSSTEVFELEWGASP